MLELLDDHLEKTRDLDGDDAERAEEFYKGIEYGGIGEPHHYVVRKDS